VKLYRSRLTLRSASASHWQADTIFGHLCWHIARWHDESRLNDLLEQCRRGKPPALLSDGFPRDYMPRPILPRAGAPQHLSKADRVKHHFDVKFAGQSEWLTLEGFNQLRRGETMTSLLKEKDVELAAGSRSISKNQVDRRTNTAGGDGGKLFDFVETILPEVTIYWRIEDDWEKTVGDFLEDLKASGYGKRKSVGYGQIESFTFEEFHGLDETPPRANGFISLSRFVPAPNDPTDGYWDIAVKYGKLGEELAVSGRPFKRPLIQLECGSCFFDEVKPDWVNRWYGRLVDGVVTQDQEKLYGFEVKQYGFAFLVPMRIAL